MRNEKVKKMVAIAFLMALVVVMQFVGGIIPPVGGFSISLVLIPIVLGAAMYGPAVGALLGATFGVIVFINCVTGSDVGGAMVFQANPILCFLVVMGKGILAGLSAGFVYKLLKNKNGYVAMLLASVVCPVVNTGIFITCLVTMFGGVLDGWYQFWLSEGNTGTVMSYILAGIVLVNFVPELLLNVVVSPASQRVLRVVKNKI